MNSTLIENLLKTKEIGRQIVFLKEIDSTNLFAREIPSNTITNGMIIVADHQTEGKGRRGRTWIDESRANILCSLILTNLKSTSLLPIIAGISIVESIFECTNLKAECKWPNDVFLNKKKISGCLIEQIGNITIIGIGINVNQNNFGDLANNATSLFNETGIKWEREVLLVNLLNRMETLLSIYENSSSQIIDLWKKYVTFIGKEVNISTELENYSATAVDITEDGLLIIRKDNNLQTLTAGDISLKINL
ncbi:MAG: biotin--[acetyl-CoA-carboxylase] ligase [Ignavibacteria bacterium]|nr:biotin--[acetyl-CoA-carboxylase] ligase [Ignavibacteria bacterium]